MGCFDLPTPKDETPKELVNAGMYPARLFRIVDLGTIDEPKYKEPDTIIQKHQVELGFELSEKMSDGRPFVISERFTLSNGKFGPYVSKNSKTFEVITGWKGWDEKTVMNYGVAKLIQEIGCECMINVLKVEKSTRPGEFKNKIGSILPMMKGMKAEDQVNPSVVYIVGKEGFDELPDFLKKRIEQSYEYQKKPLPSRGTSGEANAAAGDDHGIPF